MILISKHNRFEWPYFGKKLWYISLGWILIQVTFIPPDVTIRGFAIAIFPWLSNDDFDPVQRWIEPTELW